MPYCEQHRLVGGELLNAGVAVGDDGSGRSPHGSQRPAIEDDDYQLWLYVWEGLEYGPVPIETMREALKQGLFGEIGVDLLVRLPNWTKTVALHTAYPDAHMAFVGPPNVVEPGGDEEITSPLAGASSGGSPATEPDICDVYSCDWTSVASSPTKTSKCSPLSPPLCIAALPSPLRTRGRSILATTPQSRNFCGESLESNVLGSSSKRTAAGLRSPFAVACAEHASVVQPRPCSLEAVITAADGEGLWRETVSTPTRTSLGRPTDLGWSSPLPLATCTAAETKRALHTSCARVAEPPSEADGPDDGFLASLVTAATSAPPTPTELPSAGFTRAFAECAPMLESAPEQLVLTSEPRALLSASPVQPYRTRSQVGLAGHAFAFCGRCFRC